MLRLKRHHNSPKANRPKVTQADSAPAVQQPNPKAQSDVDHRLYQHAKNGNLEEIADLLRGTPYPNINTRSHGHEDTPTQAACRAKSNSLEICTSLLDAGAKLDSRSSIGNTALHVAILNRKFAIVQLLIEQAANPKNFDGTGSHLAEGSDCQKHFVNLKNEKNSTALHAAAKTYRSDPRLIDLLIKTGADTTLRDSHGLTALLVAAKSPRNGVMHHLLENGCNGVNEQANDNREGKLRTCLHLVCEKNEIGEMEWLLDRNADPKIRDADGKTPWDICCTLENQDNPRGQELSPHTNAIAALAKRELGRVLDVEAKTAREKEAKHAQSKNKSLREKAKVVSNVFFVNNRQSNIRGIGSKPNAWYCIQETSRFLVYGLLSLVSSSVIPPQSLTRIYLLVGQHFLEQRGSLDYISFRESHCAFGGLDTGKDHPASDLKRGRTAALYAAESREQSRSSEASEKSEKHDETRQIFTEAGQNGIMRVREQKAFEASTKSEGQKGPGRISTKPEELGQTIYDEGRKGSDVSTKAEGKSKSRRASSTSEKLDKTSNSGIPSGKEFMSLVMPYLYTDLYTTLQIRGENHAKYLGDLKYCSTTPSNVVSSAMVGVHPPLTLDEYCRPGLKKKNLLDLNKDQVLVRYERDRIANEAGEQRDNPKLSRKKNENKEAVPSSARLVTVQQAWVWSINDLLITAVSDDFLRKDLASWISVKLDKPISQKVALFLSILVDTLDRPLMAGLSEPIFNIFEKSIISVSEQVQQYLKDLDVESIHPEKEEQYFHDISDIREELAMIRSVLFQQEEVWKEFVSNALSDYWKEGKLCPPLEDREWQTIARPQAQFPKFKRRLDNIDDEARRVEESIKAQIDLKAKYAGIRESHSMNIMSTAVFGFTIVTVIFTPLSFAVSLFALPLDRFQDQQIPSRWTTDAGMYSSRYAGKWLTIVEVVSVGVTGILMWLAVEIGLRHGRNIKWPWKYTKQPSIGNASASSDIQKADPKPSISVAQRSTVRATVGSAKSSEVVKGVHHQVQEFRWWQLHKRRSRKDDALV